MPEELQEKDGSTLDMLSVECPKMLGLHWNTQTDSMYVHAPDLSSLQVPRKRDVSSSVGRVFDVMGWFAPVTVLFKILLQQLWQSKVEWDEILPDKTSCQSGTSGERSCT